MNAHSYATTEPEAPDAHHRRERVAALAAPLIDWLVNHALPMWSTTGVDRVAGGFFEKIDLRGVPVEEPRRARVVARQIYVFATAQRRGWLSGAGELVDHGLAFLKNRMWLPDGTIAASVRPDGTRVATGFDLYEHAFVLFALAAAYRCTPAHASLRIDAENLLARMRAGWRHPAAGFEEAMPRTLPLKSNPHMHLLEAALAWGDAAPETSKPIWQQLTDELVALCLDRFIDTNGALHEYFDGDWRAMPGAPGRIVEPGHQFEWAWLLMRSAVRASGDVPSTAAARLLEIGETHGVDRHRGVAINAIDQDFQVIDAAAKLWPQTERIKAWHLALLSSDATSAAAAERSLADAIAGLTKYLMDTPRGLWHEQIAADGRFDLQDCRASSLYHIVCAIDALCGAR